LRSKSHFRITPFCRRSFDLPAATWMLCICMCRFVRRSATIVIFYSLASTAAEVESQTGAYLAALATEIGLQLEFFELAAPRTIFIGGGLPPCFRRGILSGS